MMPTPSRQRVVPLVLMAVLLIVTRAKPVSADQPDADDVEIRAVLGAQAQAWNRGDIPGFMHHYWKSDQLTFSSGGTTTRGWQATIDRYKTRYDTREKMGQLEFSDIELKPLGTRHALVLGRWHLTRSEDDLGGRFTLVFKKIDRRWMIIHDHTSVETTD